MVLNWLTRIYNQGSLKIEAHNARVKDVLKEFRVKLEYYLYETYAHIIIDQFFTVIIGKLIVRLLSQSMILKETSLNFIMQFPHRFPGLKARN